MFYTMLSCESLPCLALQNRPAMYYTILCWREHFLSCFCRTGLQRMNIMSLTPQFSVTMLRNAKFRTPSGNAPQKKISALVQESGKSLSRHFKTSVLRPLYTVFLQFPCVVMHLTHPALAPMYHHRLQRDQNIADLWTFHIIAIEKQTGVFHSLGNKVGLERMMKGNKYLNVQVGSYKDGQQTSLPIESSYQDK